jgi:hypothetical protein
MGDLQRLATIAKNGRQVQLAPRCPFGSLEPYRLPKKRGLDEGRHFAKHPLLSTIEKYRRSS